MCSTATVRLEDGPSPATNFSYTNKYTDKTFEGKDQLYWEGYSTGGSASWESYLDNGYYEF